MHNLLLDIAAALITCAASVLFAKDMQTTLATTTIVTTAETVIAVGAPLTVPNTTGKASVKVSILLAPGTTTNTVTLRIYRGTSASGTLIGVANAFGTGFVAGANSAFVASATDVLAGVGTAQYCVSVSQLGATANGLVIAAMIETEVLSG